MGLAATLAKKVGVHHQLLTSAAFLAGLIVVAIFPSFDRRTEVEEHALIPGYANSGFDMPWQERLQNCIRQIEAESDAQAALDTALAQAGLKAYHMNFSTPSGSSSLTYTLAQSRRGDSREAVVLVIGNNWTVGKKATSKMSWGIATGVVLAQYLSSVHWLSKDMFVVFVDSSLAYGAGIRAWLQSYIGGHSEVRRGTLRQAVILQLKNGASSMFLEVEGINGMVPNQDIVNSYTVSSRGQQGFKVEHRQPWDSVLHHFQNGGVHSSHAPFLELQVPAFTVRGQRSKTERDKRPINLGSLVMSLEGVVRCMSNSLQQLHHSFNFYFFTGQNSHISNGLYLYPVFAMQLPLISFLATIPAYRDMQSLLIGLGTIVAISGVSGSMVFLLATSEYSPSEPLICTRPSESAAVRRHAAATWLMVALAASALAAFIIRRYAFTVFVEEERKEEKGGGLRLPCPLWEAVRAASGFAFLAVLAPVTIYSWALAMPLTIACVPVLVLARPFSFRKRPLRSLLLLSFLAGNIFLLAVPPAARADILGELPARSLNTIFDLYYRKLVPTVPREARPYLPMSLVRFVQEGKLSEALSGDLLVALYEAARDYKCVGGMLFPIFCFAYWPLLMLLVLIGAVLPAQRVDDEGLSLAQLRLVVFFVLSLVVGSVVGGVVWRSYSSHGLGQLQW
eukprot:TRINITY_DN27955_c0_g1_i1.p1 TRINITY_DN27955_c0_g1~~TRINITY_DN27955_c0_g1_i1.p1  ORF type:complete len:698 (-),score=113.91 TRINITY_DN27955_c0_g1_i1:35-2068(-)